MNVANLMGYTERDLERPLYQAQPLVWNVLSTVVRTEWVFGLRGPSEGGEGDGRWS